MRKQKNRRTPICPNCNQRNFPVKKLYAKQRGDGKARYAGFVCNRCFIAEMERLREKHNNPNFFSDDIKDLDLSF